MFNPFSGSSVTLSRVRHHGWLTTALPWLSSLYCLGAVGWGWWVTAAVNSDRYGAWLLLGGGVSFSLLPFALIRILTRSHATTRNLAASIYHNTIEGIVITDARGVILAVNPAFTELTGYSSEEAVGNTPRLLKSDHHDQEFYSTMWRELTATGRWQGELWNRRKNGEVFLEWQTITMIPGLDGGPTHYVAVFNDITEQRRKDERIRRLAFHDPLTGLSNRTLLMDRLQHALNGINRSKERLALLFMDLDRFKLVNDTLGHDVGDELLRLVATRIQELLRASDTLSRLGGDEFVILLENNVEAREVAHVAERIIHTLNQPMTLKQHPVQIGVSVGIALSPEDGAEVTILMKCADTAMYAAKAAGKNTHRFHSQMMSAQAGEKLQLENDLRTALLRGEFELFYQPKICLQSGRTCGAEALIRWRHPRRGLVAPGQFIPLAEETGLIVPLSDWVLEAACREIVAWQTRGMTPGKVAINLSAVQLRDDQLPGRLQELLTAHGIGGHQLELELTESTVMSDPERAIPLLKQLRALGVSIAVDDFGTGYSSLSYLRRLPLDTLKIDRSFIMELEHVPEAAEVAKLIMGLGKALNLNLVAEGVETEGQAEFLRANGCPMAQGYLYGKPMPVAEFEQWFLAR